LARPLRIQFENALYHVTSRGNGKAAIYDDDKDRHVFIKILASVVEQYAWVVYAYCLMSNHYHLLVKTPKANLSTGMRQLNGVYSQYYNNCHDRAGHLFQGRYNAILIKDERRLLAVARYVVLNPVRAGLVVDPEDWRWSSFRGTAGLNRPPIFIDPDQLLCFFASDRSMACRDYYAFVKAGIDVESPLSDARGGVLAGDIEVIEVTAARLMGEISEEVPKRERFADRPTLETIFKENDRDIGIYKAFRKYEYRLKEIGDFLGLHYSTVSGIAKRIGG
jgi:REP element-mobilizing transposase RayT